MSETALATEFIYDALRKVAVARGVDADGGAWTLEFLARDSDDSMTLTATGPDGATRRLTATEDDFGFEGGLVTLRGLPGVTLRMGTIYWKKLRGFTRGNIPTPDIAGPSLP
jgi:hypothetical protein